ncbi:hypothetical protein [Sphingosinicella rhizophila]|uniref:Uncharacterized protein n=1 Tax=Sphingosinicella rhizophila TaxID=3050082 RepID=A0ABU3Q9T1_9SPHN|nr:hypothetical protein [Sphingosinicella sp. GR2756]MDT9600161.1 hypothetical protein [Sphingosinicella sp. GR2756]
MIETDKIEAFILSGTASPGRILDMGRGSREQQFKCQAAPRLRVVEPVTGSNTRS